VHAHANADKLRQIIINLLSNACEASPAEKPVFLEIAPVGNGEWAHVCVRNDTTGEPLDTERIVETFYTTKARGTGLGVAIVKGTVEALEGRFSIEQGGNGEVRAKVVLPGSASCRLEQICREIPELKLDRVDPPGYCSLLCLLH
jgi:signal transduction histidine kinase